MSHSLVRALPLVLLTSLVLLAQPATVTINQGPTFITGAGQDGCVKDSAGNLYVLGVIDNGTTRPITIFQSSDGGATFVPWITSGISDASSGESGSNLLNGGEMCIDDQDRLHIKWSRNYYPSFFNTYYRNLDIATATVGPLVDLTASLGISNTSRDASSAIEMAPDGRIWVTAPSTSSWREQLLVSDVPYAATGTFTSVGIPTATGFSVQNCRLAADVNGLIHTFYYRNTSPGEVAHRYYDPVALTWGPETALGNSTSPQDNYCDLAADYMGNVHALYALDASGGTIAPQYEYRRWDAVNGWSSPITIAAFTNAQMTDPATGQVSTAKMADLAVNETTGDVFVVLRDMATDGGLYIFRKAANENEFYRSHQLAPGSTNRNQYVTAYLRGSLFPGFNNTIGDLDCVWRENAAAPLYMQFTTRPGSPVGTATTVGTGCIGSNGLAPTLSAPPPILGSGAWGLTLSDGPASGTTLFYLALAPTAATPTPLGGGCDLYLDLTAALNAITIGASPLGPLPLDASGSVTLSPPLAYVPALAGFQVSVQAFCPDSTTVGFTLSNALDITLGY